MKLTQLKYFSSVCHLGSITRASEELHISQPAVTAAVRELENELGLLLLIRGKRSVTPTPDGEAFLRRCDFLLSEAEKLEEDFREKSRSMSAISVGIPPMVGYFLFPRIFEGFAAAHPDIRVRLTETGSDTARDMVRSGELELAIVGMEDTPPAGLDFQPLIRAEMLFSVSPDNRLAGKEYVDLRDVAGEPLISFTSGHYHEEVLRRRFAREKLEPCILFYSNQLLTIKSFVKKNLAGAFLLPQVIDPDESISTIPLSEPLWLNIAVVWRRDSFISAPARSFIRFIKSSLTPISS